MSHKCADCGLGANETFEFYFLHDRVWLTIANKDEDLCVSCAEARLGRTLISTDFTSCYINRSSWGAKSARLLNRLVAVT